MTNILYMGIARVPDKSVIANHAAVDSKEYPKHQFDEKLSKVLSSGRIDQHDRLTIADKEVGSIHYNADPALLYLGAFRAYSALASG